MKQWDIYPLEMLDMGTTMGKTWRTWEEMGRWKDQNGERYVLITGDLVVDGEDSQGCWD